MSDWTDGYVTDIGYTYGYYNELNPNRATLAFLNAGLAPPSTGIHCELGYGQGLSINIHAAASGLTWYGADFNPSQAAFAQSLATASGANADLTDEAFIDFCIRSEIPEFDSIGLHGIWSWISDENRSVIVDFIRRKLKVGGALYISYNTLPGWATFAPMRHLMTEHASVMGSPGNGVVSRVDGALKFAQKLIETNPMFVRANPSVADRLKKVAEQNRHYLAHEYFNKDWHPMHFATMSDWLSPAKISFACSAHYLDHIDAINLTAEQQTMLKEINDPAFKESARDFMVNQQFRRDYWIKGARKLSAIEQVEQIKEHRLVLTTPKEDVSLKITGSLGDANLSEAIYAPFLNLMSDYKVRSIGEIAENLNANKISLAQVIQIAMVLIGASHMASVQTEDQITKSRTSASKLNNLIIEKSQSSADITFLASPLTGGGIAVNRFEQLFLFEIKKGIKEPIDLAKAAWRLLESQNQLIIKNGKTINTSEENLYELKAQALKFTSNKLALLKSLLIVD